MKDSFIYIRTYLKALPIAILFFMGIGLFSCEDDELAAPEITSLRITDPEKADSTFSGGDLGQMIVIVGRNLGTTREIYFNDVEAYVNPNYVTDEHIILSVPLGIPSELNNMITVVTLGGTATHPFDVAIPGPVISKVSLEMVSPGDVVTITGDYFFSSEVTVDGNPAEVISETQKELVVGMPSGITNGVLSIKTLFGEGSYSYKLNDMGTVLLDWDTEGGRDCWQKLVWVEEDNAAPPVPFISGGYGRVYGENMGQTGWYDPGVITTCGGAGVSGDVSKMAMKFEVNVPDPVQAGYYEISFQNTYYYRLNLWGSEPFETEGWQTVTIPLSNFKDGGGAPLSNTGNIGDVWFIFKIDDANGNNPIFNWNIDNLRIVSTAE